MLICLLFSVPVAYSTPGFMVDSDWLSEHKDDRNLVILEVRYYPHRYFTVGHIPGAIQVQRFKDLGDNNADPLMRFPSRKAFQETLRRWGINDDSTLVLYDDSNTALVSRLYYLLELFGFNMQQVKILSGGTVEWSAFEEMTSEPTPAPKPGNVTLKSANPQLFVEWTDVSLEGTSAQKWRSDSELAKLYKPVSREKTVYVYCHDGFRMSLAYMHLKHLGYKDVRLYNGGWSHWGNRLTLPVVEGEKPYAGGFDL